MSNQFKPGDMALIVGTHGKNPECIGLCVRLTRLALNHGSMRSWHWDGCPAQLGTDERHLMPLPGNFQPERQKSQEVPA